MPTAIAKNIAMDDAMMIARWLAGGRPRPAERCPALSCHGTNASQLMPTYAAVRPASHRPISRIRAPSRWVHASHAAC